MQQQNVRKIILILLIISAIWGVYLLKDVIYVKLDQWKLIPRPERFTELYFNDHNTLPKQISKGGKIKFSFVIHNLEGRAMEYPYIVYFKSPDGLTVPIKEGSVAIAAGESRIVEETYTAAFEENKGGIFVELIQKQQKIHFLLNNN
jgi:hypothetical protein